MKNKKLFVKTLLNNLHNLIFLKHFNYRSTVDWVKSVFELSKYETEFFRQWLK